MSVCLSTTRGGDVPRPGLARGSTPAGGEGGPTPQAGQDGGNHLGYPPGQEGACPGYPPARSGDTCPGYPLPGQDGWVPQPGGGGCPHRVPPAVQQMEYLTCNGRYASCNHAGGLSCSEVVFACGRKYSFILWKHWKSNEQSNQIKQESPPAWTQDGYRPRRIKYAICYLRWGTPPSRGTPLPGVPTPSQVSWGYLRWGTPQQGYPLARSDRGYLRWGAPQKGYTPQQGYPLD